MTLNLWIGLGFIAAPFIALAAQCVWSLAKIWWWARNLTTEKAMTYLADQSQRRN